MKALKNQKKIQAIQEDQLPPWSGQYQEDKGSEPWLFKQKW